MIPNLSSWEKAPFQAWQGRLKMIKKRVAPSAKEAGLSPNSEMVCRLLLCDVHLVRTKPLHIWGRAQKQVIGDSP
jgi:hypothetical protein